MSRRREASDLARALLLSTQEHDLSFSSPLASDPPSGPSTSSRISVMEPLHLPRLGVAAGVTGGGDGNGSGSSSRISEIGAFSGSSGNPPPGESAIKSFTPSYHLPTKNILVPPSNTPPIPRSSAVIPSSNLPRSSPILPPAGRPSKSSGDTPSTGPLFSPTQTSALNGLIPSAPASAPVAAAAAAAERPAVLRTYGKAPSNISPEKRTEPAMPRPRISMLLSSSPEVQEEVEDRLSSRSKPASRVEVTIPSRARPSPTKRARSHSPDPLDSLEESSESLREIESLKSIAPPPAAAAPSASRASTSGRTDTQSSRVEESGRRVSARQQQHKEEEERKTMERRRKRAEDKARAKAEEDRKAAEAAGERAKGKSTDQERVKPPTREERVARRSEVVPPSKDSRERAPPSKDTNNEAEKATEREREKSKSRDRVVIEIDDEESIVPLPLVKAADAAPKALVPAKKDAKTKEKGKAKDKGKKRKAVLEEDELEEEPTKLPADKEGGKKQDPDAAADKEREQPSESLKEVSPEKGKGKKRSRVVESSDEEGEGAKRRGKKAPVPNAPKEKVPPVDNATNEDENEEEEEIVQGGSEPLRPSKIPSPLGDLASGRSREPLRPIPPHVNSPAPERASPGPNNTPGGIKWKTSRSDLSSVLSKFPGAKYTGMSRRHRIPSLHTKIGPGVKALPPPPPKPTRKKKGDSDDEDEEEEVEESDGEGGVRMVKRGGKKERGIEWFMQED